MADGLAGLLGHHAPGAEGQDIDPALIPVLRTGGNTVSEKPLRRPTVKIKICNISSQSEF